MAPWSEAGAQNVVVLSEGRTIGWMLRMLVQRNSTDCISKFKYLSPKKVASFFQNRHPVLLLGPQKLSVKPLLMWLDRLCYYVYRAVSVHL